MRKRIMAVVNYRETVLLQYAERFRNLAIT
jgi:hypothetical protein